MEDVVGLAVGTVVLVASAQKGFEMWVHLSGG